MKKMTEKNLQDAFAGESMAHMKYLAFGDEAAKAGYPNLSRLFQAIAYAERVHATNHARNLGLIKKTLANIQSGIDGEDYEIDEMYPAFLAVAELQGEKGAQKSMHFAIEAEKIHSEMYKDAKQTVEKGQDLEIETVYICPVCGFTSIDDLPEKCPVCGVAGNEFRKF